MRAARYRLKFFTGATLTASTYGGGAYGDGTYGMQKSDALTTAHHRLVPWPAGALTSPSWRYRQNDTNPPLELMILADDGVVDLTGVTSARLVLTPVDDPAGSRGYAMAGIGTHIRRIWTAGDLNRAGVFRVGVALTYDTGRRLSVPGDDRHTMVVTPDGS